MTGNATHPVPFYPAVERHMLWPEARPILRAALLDGEAGSAAWQLLLGGTDQHPLRDLPDSFKALLPLLFTGARRTGVALPEADATVLRTAHLREERRIATYDRIVVDVLRRLSAAGTEPLLVGGAALAAMLYDSPADRHSHDIDLLLDDDDAVAAAAATLDHAGRVVRDEATGAQASVRLPSGMHAHLASRPLRHRFADIAVPALRSRAMQVRVRDYDVITLSPPDALVVAGGRAWIGGPPAPLWLCDMWKLSARLTTEDWSHVIDLAGDTRLALPAAALLHSLRRDLDAPVPDEAIELLAERVATDPAQRDAFLYRYRIRAGIGALGLLRRDDMAGHRRDIVRHLVVPSADHIAVLHGGRRDVAVYLGRPPAYLVRAGRRALRRLMP